MSNPARTSATGRRTANWLAIALVASVLCNIATPVWYSLQSRAKDKVVVFDLASGSLLLSPVVDPSDSKEIVDTSVSWAVKSILDRNPAGLDNEELIPLLFDVNTAREVREEFAQAKAEYAAKNLRSHVEIKSIDAQPIGNGIIKSRVVGQIVTTGTVHGTATQEVRPVSIDLSLARNPDLGRNKKYPLMVFQYTYASSEISQK